MKLVLWNGHRWPFKRRDKATQSQHEIGMGKLLLFNLTCREGTQKYSSCCQQQNKTETNHVVDRIPNHVFYRLNHIIDLMSSWLHQFLYH